MDFVRCVQSLASSKHEVWKVRGASFRLQKELHKPAEGHRYD